MIGFLKKDNVKDFRKYRWFYTSKGNLVVGGKSDEQNELVIKYFLKSNYWVVHTSSPGSPFMIIQNDNPSKDEIEESAIYCTCFSKQWKILKNNNEKISIDVFRGNQIYKTKFMKKGTFGVKGKIETIKVKPELILIIQMGKLRSIPRIKNEDKNFEILAEIKPGNMDKIKTADKIYKKIKDKYNYPVSKEEIMQVIPSDKMGVK